MPHRLLPAATTENEKWSRIWARIFKNFWFWISKKNKILPESTPSFGIRVQLCNRGLTLYERC